jgi:hypothetical protein
MYVAMARNWHSYAICKQHQKSISTFLSALYCLHHLEMVEMCEIVLFNGQSTDAGNFILYLQVMMLLDMYTLLSNCASPPLQKDLPKLFQKYMAQQLPGFTHFGNMDMPNPKCGVAYVALDPFESMHMQDCSTISCLLGFLHVMNQAILQDIEHHMHGHITFRVLGVSHSNTTNDNGCIPMG